MKILVCLLSIVTIVATAGAQDLDAPQVGTPSAEIRPSESFLAMVARLNQFADGLIALNDSFEATQLWHQFKRSLRQSDFDEMSAAEEIAFTYEFIDVQWRVIAAGIN